jgi:hypothetical protein
VLTITVPGVELFDENTSTFSTLEDVVLELEHSLVSLSKWESIWEKPFLVPGEKTTEETMGYYQCMTLTPNVSPDVYRRLTNEHAALINNYIEAKKTATWFKELPNASRNSQVITSELIYYWMDALQINWEAQHWHLNRLFTLIKVHNTKNQPQKKMTGQQRMDAAAQRRTLNQQRKAQMNSNG